MFKSSVFTIAALTASQGAFAQQLPDAGRQIRELPALPELPKPAPDIRIEQRGAAVEESAGASIRVDTLRLTGQTLFSESALIAATGFRPGSTLSLSELRGIASQISAYYHRQGYFLAQAYLPAQDIKNASVTITVIEGRYGSIDLRNRSRLSDGVARSLLAGLDNGAPVAMAPLERRLLLLSDIPGTAVRSTLTPGAAPGTSDLIVEIDPGRRVTGSIEADNGGNRYTGAYRFGGTVNLNNPTGNGDVASLRLLASDGGLFYGRAAYQTLVGAATVGVSYAHIDYRLGREFKSLDARGTADIVSLYGSYPLIRSRHTNLYTLAAVESKAFRDKTGLSATVIDKKVQALTAGLNGDHHDGFNGGGWTTVSWSATVGNLDRQSPLDLAADRVTARSNGSYGVVRFSAARLQTLAGPVSLFASIRGQLATKNVDSSEQMALGGSYGVRAYPEGESYGDQGYVAAAEARLLLPKFSPRLPGQLQLIGFVDTGAVTIAKNPWFTGPNRARRSGDFAVERDRPPGEHRERPAIGETHIRIGPERDFAARV